MSPTQSERGLHPDDVNARDWEFMLSDRFPGPMPESEDGEWAQGAIKWLSKDRRRVARARVAIENAWPSSDKGETLAPLVAKLEAALDAAINAPAVSTSDRGESENAAYANLKPEPQERSERTVLRRRRNKRGEQQREEVREARLRHFENRSEIEKVMRQREKGPKDAKMGLLQLRLRTVCRRFAEMDVLVEPLELSGALGVQLSEADVRRLKLPTSVMVLSEAENWLDYVTSACDTPPEPKIVTQLDI